MKRAIGFALACGLLWSTSGCIVAASVKGNRFEQGRQVVAVGDDVYIVETATGRVMKVNLREAEPFTPVDDGEDSD